MPPHPIVALPSDLYRTSSISYLFCLKEGVEQKLSWVGTPAPFNHHLHIYEEASSATFLDPARGLTRIYGLRLLIKFYVLPTTKWRILCCYFRLWLVVFLDPAFGRWKGEEANQPSKYSKYLCLHGIVMATGTRRTACHQGFTEVPILFTSK